MNFDDIRGKAVITVTDCARLLGMDERSVRRGIEEGDLPGIKVGRRILIPVPKLLALFDDQTIEATLEQAMRQGMGISAAFRYFIDDMDLTEEQRANAPAVAAAALRRAGAGSSGQ